jgi:hypothetical protein
MMHVLNRLFPAVFYNTFPGQRIALWVFYALTALTLWRSWHHLTAPDGGAQSIATIPLDSYPAGAAATVVGIFALWGLSQLIIGLLYLTAAIRYRSLIPLFYLLLIAEYAVRMLIGGAKPIETAGTAPGAVGNLPLMVLAAVMLVLCLIPRKSN